MIKVGVKIEPTAEWSRFLWELKRQALDEGVTLTGRITIDAGPEDKIEIEL